MHGPENEKCIAILLVLFRVCTVIQISLSFPFKKSGYHRKRFTVSEDKCVSEQAILMGRTVLSTLSVYRHLLRNCRKHYKHYYYYRYSALGPVWAETRAQSGDWYDSGTLHPGQILRSSLPLLSPIISIPD
jgi:hypothetical protein